MRLIELLRSSQDSAERRWQKTPEHTVSEAVLILAKALLLDANDFAAEAERYRAESVVRKEWYRHQSIIRAVLKQVLAATDKLLHTPLGDEQLQSALELIKEEAQ
ncbi:MAG TPA: hypothetical protein PKZ40_03750 [Anaerolineaceae bacterium]|nr:hypothetical protein [Clostridia bacterium]HPK26837.1 hypothetical protein [Anaerolineaceae bacterium]